MSLRTRITALAQAIGVDIKDLRAQVSGATTPTLTYNPWQRFNIASNTTSINATYTVGMLNVYFRGRLLRPNGDDYTATDGTTINFTFTLVPGDEIDVETVKIAEVTSNQTVTIDRQLYTSGLAGQTTFNVKYTPPYAYVTVNGFLLPTTDYVATNGTSITLGSALTADDISVDLIGYTAFAVSNTYTLAQADAKFIPQDPTATAAKATLDGTETLQADSSGLKKFTVQKIIDFLLARVNSWSAANTFTATSTFKAAVFSAHYGNGNSGTAATINFSNGNKQGIILTGNATLTLVFPGVGNYQLLLNQDATGGRTVTWTGYATIAYVGSATAPAINTGASSQTIVSFYYNGVTGVWLAASKVNA